MAPLSGLRRRPAGRAAPRAALPTRARRRRQQARLRLPAARRHARDRRHRRDALGPWPIPRCGALLPISQGIADVLGIGEHGVTDADRSRRVLDAGCGTGHYLRALLDRLPDAHGLAADLSVDAVRTAVRGRHDVDGVVADTWAGLPVRDSVADLVLDVFAPRNMADFHRILRSGGLLLIVAAGPEHLRQLREAGRAVGIQADKRERILASADALFEPLSETRVRHDLLLPPDDIDRLLGMGPSAHHPHARAGSDVPCPEAGSSPTEVTLDVTIHLMRRSDTPGT
ncbi:methyltransferase domain-containing protein [Clavibacter tessellarius]|uniref:methyltransferase domain-containing protein n=1 Tax=Clavibacter tessellarius TaxID=31965 RepID=UPI00324A35CF